MGEGQTDSRVTVPAGFPPPEAVLWAKPLLHSSTIVG